MHWGVTYESVHPLGRGHVIRVWPPPPSKSVHINVFQIEMYHDNDIKWVKMLKGQWNNVFPFTPPLKCVFDINLNAKNYGWPLSNRNIPLFYSKF